MGKRLEAQTGVQKAQLNNVASAKNYLSTAETALQQVNDKLNQITSKYTDSNDPLKDKASIAADIRTLAGEVDSILKNTNINGRNLLAKNDGSTLASSDVFDVSGLTFTADFASNTYLNSDALKAALHGTSATDPGVTSFDGTSYDKTTTAAGAANVNYTLAVNYADGTHEQVFYAEAWNGQTYSQEATRLKVGTDSFMSNTAITIVDDGGNQNHLHFTALNGKKITSIATTGDVDLATMLNATKQSTPSGGTAGLLDANDNNVLTSASDISAISTNVKNALGRVGNLSQTLDSRSDFLTSAIANNTATISNIFDADVAGEQLNATRGGIAGQVATAMLSQLNTAPQKLMSLFS